MWQISYFSWKKLFSHFFSIRLLQRRRETPCGASNDVESFLLYGHMGKQNNSITREILMLAMWFIEQKTILFRCRIDNRDVPARPDPRTTSRSLTLYNSKCFEDKSLRFSQYVWIMFKFFRIKFSWDSIGWIENCSCFSEHWFSLIFRHFFAYNLNTVASFGIIFIACWRTSEVDPESIWSLLEFPIFIHEKSVFK